MLDRLWLRRLWLRSSELHRAFHRQKRVKSTALPLQEKSVKVRFP